MVRGKTKVIVALSGGVDSSVAAALLKEAGFDVRGIFMKLYKSVRFEKNERKARRIAKGLRIPLLSLDLRKEFKKRIIDHFLEEYREGKTPNPCVVCNKEIKFGLVLERALKSGAGLIATGHYARLEGRKGRIALLKSRDKEKDQSYFLWQLNQKQLGSILFPVGGYKRDEVQKLAKRFKLPLSDSEKSVEICFIDKTIDDFLEKNIRSKLGKIVDTEDKVIGKHQGLHLYTIGQRKGIKLPAGPYYVLDKNQRKNLLIVTRNQKDLYKKELVAKNVSWISGKEPKLPLKIKAKIRYRHLPALATITGSPKPGNWKVRFAKLQRAITPGQSVVFYKGQEVLGGGIIKKTT